MDQENLNSKQEPKAVPMIRTMSSDITTVADSQSIDKLKLISAQMDANNSFASANISEVAQSIDNKKRIILISSILLIVLFLFSAAGYYYFVIMPRQNIQPVPVVNVKTYNIRDFWPSASSFLLDNTGQATATADYILIEVKNFDSLYAYVINSENVFKNLAKERFGYEELGQFADVSISNQDLRIADGIAGPLVYGFIDKKYLLISNSLNTWIEKSQK
jgi:hypothetical protein